MKLMVFRGDRDCNKELTMYLPIALWIAFIVIVGINAYYQ